MRRRETECVLLAVLPLSGVYPLRLLDTSDVLPRDEARPILLYVGSTMDMTIRLMMEVPE